MKKIRLLLLLTASLAVMQIHAQKFEHNLGIDIRFPGSKIITTSATYQDSAYLFESSYTKITRVGLSYYPRYTFLKKNRFSISIGIPLTLGIALSSAENTYMYVPLSSAFKPYGNINKSTRLAVEVPVVADINFRVFQTARNRDRLVVFVGGGYAYGHTSFKVQTDMYSNLHNIDAYQAYFHAGIRILGKSPITIAATYRPANPYGWGEGTPSWGIQLLRKL